MRPVVFALFVLFHMSVIVAPAAHAQQSQREDAATLIQRVIEAQPRVQLAQRAFTFRERTVERKLRSDGSVSESKSESFVVTPTTEGEYRRLVAKNGNPLSARAESKQERKLEEHIEEQLRLTADERDAKTQEKLDKRVERYQNRLEEALEVFDFAPMPDERIDEHPIRVFSFTAKPGYEGHSRSTKVFARMRGSVWIDAERDQLVKLSLGFNEDLKFLGGVFGRISKDTRATIVAALHDELWLLDDADVELHARLYFLKRYRQNITVDYDDYQEFQVDTEEKLSLSTPTLR